MSSKPSPNASTDAAIGNGDLNDRHRTHPSIVRMKETIGYDLSDDINSAEAVAKYVAIRHPNFDIFPALPTQFHVEFEESLIEGQEQNGFTHVAKFVVSIGDQHLRKNLGTIRIKREYDSLDAAERLSSTSAVSTDVGYTETPTP